MHLELVFSRQPSSFERFLVAFEKKSTLDLAAWFRNITAEPFLPISHYISCSTGPLEKNIFCKSFNDIIVILSTWLDGVLGVLLRELLAYLAFLIIHVVSSGK